MLLRRRALEILRATRLWAMQRLGLAFYHPVQVIRRVELHGDPDYGGWYVCPDGINAGSVVYDVGVGEDISFAKSLVLTYGLRIWAFDPTPRSIGWFQRQTSLAQLTLRPHGISDVDGETTFYLPNNPRHVSGTIIPDEEHRGGAIQVPVRRLATVMAELGHRVVDILKLDIEGAEYKVLRDLLLSGLRIDQVLVEFHHSRASTKHARAREAIEELNRHGYKIFAVRHGTDFSFIRAP